MRIVKFSDNTRTIEDSDGIVIGSVEKSNCVENAQGVKTFLPEYEEHWVASIQLAGGQSLAIAFSRRLDDLRITLRDMGETGSTF